ncbi:MAG: CrcB family protein [Humibacillus sp.]|nr:CrcB family protein [Humibacillus sp.]MDN5776630.1 CrcB family protein [Humibacillus sp.]
MKGARPRPAHLRWGPIGLVAVGGALGTAAREGMSLALPPTGAFPLAIFLVNVTGAFALGLLLEMLLRHGPDRGLRRSLRLLVGTGFMGGYTTYSTLAVGAGQSVISGQPVLGLVYAFVSVVVGAAAAFAGIATGAEVHRRRGPERERERRS